MSVTAADNLTLLSRTGKINHPCSPSAVLSGMSSKSCHVKNFGTRDLRQANLPHREGSSPTPSPLPASPIRHNTFSVPPVPSQHYRVSSPPPLRFSSSADSKYVPNVSLSASVLPPNRMPSPIITSNLRYDTPPVESHEAAWEMSKSMDQVTTQSRSSPLGPSYTGQRPTPETGQVNDRPLHKPSNSLSATPMKFFPATLGRSISPATSTPNASYSPLAPTATGTRYGVALNTTGTTAGGSSARKWGGGTPTCPKCGNSVFFAEQVGLLPLRLTISC
jgi:hypothetical protein